MLRVIAIVAGACAVWLVVAADVPRPVRLPLSGVVVGAVITQPFGCTDLELEPYDEEAHRLLMRAHHESGDHALAVRHYQALEAMLHRDLGAEPEPATRELYQRIRRAG